MFKKMDLAATSLLVVGGLNALAVAAGKVDILGATTGRWRFGRPNTATRALYGLVGGSAIYTLSRVIQREAF